jgi:hypothetical protein
MKMAMKQLANRDGTEISGDHLHPEGQKNLAQ